MISDYWDLINNSKLKFYLHFSSVHVPVVSYMQTKRKGCGNTGWISEVAWDTCFETSAKECCLLRNLQKTLWENQVKNNSKVC